MNLSKSNQTSTFKHLNSILKESQNTLIEFQQIDLMQSI